MSNITNQKKNTGTGTASPTTALGEQLSAVDLGSQRNNTNEDAALQRRLHRLTSLSSSSGMDIDSDKFVVRYDSSVPAGFALPELGTSVVRSLGVTELVKNIEELIPDQEARDHYAYNEVRARRARCLTIDRAVITNETDDSDLDERIAANTALEPAVLAAERLDSYRSSGLAAQRATVRMKRTSDKIGRDEERVGTSKKRKIVVPGMDKVKRVEVESYDVAEVDAEFKKLEETANANLSAPARLQHRREKNTLVLLQRRLREARPELLAKQYDLALDCKADLLLTGWVRSLKSAMRKGRLGDAITDDAATKLLDGLVAPPKKKKAELASDSDSESE